MHKINKPRFVLDTSVVINLLSTGHFTQILESLGPPFVIVENVRREVKFAPETRQMNESVLVQYVKSGVLQVEDLADEELNTFVELAGAPSPDDLDDGEAASIAYAMHNGLSLVIDETKGRRVCKEKLPSLPICDTVDLLKMCAQTVSLSPRDFIKAIENALTIGRMRVAPHHSEWVASNVSRVVLESAPSLRRRRIG